jgi:YbbR domain-containing protein
MPVPYKKKKIRKHFLKILALLLSLLLWVYIVGTSEIEIEKTVSLKIVPTKGKVVSNLYPSEVVYTLRGPRALMRTFANQEIQHHIDLQKIKPKRNNYYELLFGINSLRPPLGMTILKVSPRVQKIYLEKEFKKTVPINVSWLNDFRTDKQLAYLEFEPKETTIRGPKRLISEIEYVQTNPIDSMTLDSSGEFLVSLVKPDERVFFNYDVQPLMRYRIHNNKVSKKFEDMKIIFIGKRQFQVKNLPKVNLQILADQELLNRISKEDIEVVAELPAIGAGKTPITLKVNLPPEVNLVDISPKSLFVTLK